MTPSFEKMLSDKHRRVSRSLAFLLHDGDNDRWCDAWIIWRARLTPTERVQLAYSSIKSLDPEQTLMVVETVFASWGVPLPPFLDLVGESSDWAAFAHPEQRNAVFFACWNEMSPKERAEFLDHVSRRAE